MKPFTNTAAGRKRLIRVCDVVRKRMGLGDLPYEYDFDKPDGTMVAGAWINHYGWEVRITFHPMFFRLSFERQIHTIIHEHVHCSMAPLLQVVNNTEAYRKDKNNFKTEVYRADEIATDHLVMPWLHYMRPEILKAAA